MARKKRQRTRPDAPRLSRRKLNYFRLLVVSLPVLLLVACEVTLRLFGLGGYAPMLRRVGEVEGGTLVVADQGGAHSWFFASPTRTGRNEQYAFLDPKPTNTVRIFFVGASVIEGYPEPRHLAASAFLQEMLRDAWPDRNVEVINLGVTAIASFPVLGIMTEALDYEPDLIVVHTGHNEFFGTYGVASAGRAGRRPWMLQATRVIHSFAIVQGLDILLHPADEQRDRTLMEAMMGRQHIGPHDWRRKAAANNLYHNVTEMIDRCHERDIPILICTQPTNEKDLAPVGNDSLNDLTPAERQEANTILDSLKTEDIRQSDSAESALRRLIELAPNHARAHYLLAQIFADQQQYAEARDEFLKARDLDPLPWRIPTESQSAVLRAASEHDAPVCDLVKAFHDASTNGIIGWDLMDDHVHPTLRGQALTAETILDCLTRFEGPLNVSPEARNRIASWTEYADRLGENIYDRYAVAHAMRLLFAAPFMRENNPDAFGRFDEMANEIESGLPGEVRDVMREWQETQPYGGARCPIAAAVAQLLVKQGDYTNALKLYRIALLAVPEYTSWHLEYAYYSLFCKNKLAGGLTIEDLQEAHRAIRQGHFLCKNIPDTNGFNERHTGFLHLLCNEFAEAIPFLEASQKQVTGVDRLAVDQALVVCFLRTGRFEDARQTAAAGAARPDGYSDRYNAILKNLPALIEAARSAENPNQPSPDQAQTQAR